MTKYMVGNIGLIVLPVTLQAYNFVGSPIISGLRLYGAGATISGTDVSYATWEVMLDTPNLGNSSNAALGWLVDMEDDSVTGVILRNTADKAIHIYEADRYGVLSLSNVVPIGNKGYLDGLSNKKYMVHINLFSSRF
jgi:hypothetical protein